MRKYNRRNFFYFLSGAVTASSTLSACGGGSSGTGNESSSPTQSNTTPTLGSESSSSSSASSSSSVTTNLKTAYKKKFLIGTAIEPYDLEDSDLKSLITAQCNSITAENAMKPHVIGVREGVYNFEAADKIVDFALAIGCAVRGHTLVWHRHAPDWFFEGDQSNYAEYQRVVKSRLEKYVGDVVNHYKGRISDWDAVNEPTSDDFSSASLYREDSPWYKVLGPSYIDYVLQTIRKTDPSVKIFINEYGNHKQQKRNKLTSILRDLQLRGIPIDGVGHQMHWSINATLNEELISEMITEVEQLGLINHITELDMSIYESGDVTTDYGSVEKIPQAILEAQALRYKTIYAALSKHTSVTSVTGWGISDKHSWLNSTPNRYDAPLLFDRNLNAKAAFQDIISNAEKPNL